MAHAWHDIELPTNNNYEEIPVVIEIPAGSKVKYELDKRSGLIRVDRVLYTSMVYPANYGIIPRTYADDGDPLDVLVLGQAPVVPLSILIVRPIGGFRMTDENKIDDKVVCVHAHDPSVADYNTVDELPQHSLTEMMHFFSAYKKLEGKETAVDELLSRAKVLELIAECADNYRERYP